MSNPHTYVRRAGLVLTLLVVAMVGGLMTPLPANAVNATRPTLFIEVTVCPSTGCTTTTPFNTRQQIQLGNPVTCLSSAQNYCYPLKVDSATNSDAYINKVNGIINYYGPAGHQFLIQDYVPTTNPARVNINDLKTSSNSTPADVIIVTGMKLIPVTTWGQYDLVRVKLIVTNKFDAQPNSPGANGTTSFYPFGMSIGGQYNTSPAPTGNFYQMWGRGTFVTNADGSVASGQPKNIANQFNPDTEFTVKQGTPDSRCYGTPLANGGTKYPLCQYIAGATSTQSSFNSSQTSAYYPGGSTSLATDTRFACTNNKPATNGLALSVVDPNGVTQRYDDPSCQPLIIETHAFYIWGPDQIFLTTSSHSGGGVCSDSDNKLPLCTCFDTHSGKKVPLSVCNAIESFISAENQKELDPNFPPVLECTDVICSGRIDVNIAVNQGSIGLTFPFIAFGPGVGSFSITTTGGSSGQATGVLTDPFVKLITGHGGAEGGGQPLLIMPDYDNPDWPRPDANSFYTVDQMLFSSANGSTIIGTDTFVASCGGDKGPGFVFFIGRDSAGQGDGLSLKIHIHSEQHAGTVCPF